MSTHASALAVGHRLDEYLIARLLGHGGFGLTYLAQDTNLNAFVAIKEFLPQEFAVRGANSRVMPRSDSDNDSYRWGLDRFKEEARALARFKHPNIVRAARLLEANGTAYMVMDFEPGMTLSQYLKRHGPVLDEARLLGIFQPVLDGLEALHAQQLVHRDIKPGNIYVRARGGPMLIDFGAVRQAIGAHSRSLTSLVTPGYAPIEQYSSDGRQGAWSDLYAVGATMYYCMFGHAPADAARRSAAISDGSEDPYLTAKSKSGGRYSEELVEAVDWALQFRVRDRPQVAHDLRERLRRSPVTPVSVDLPESLAEMPELQNGIISNQGSIPSAAVSLNPMFAMPHSDSLLHSERRDSDQTMPAMAKTPFVGTAKVGPDGVPAMDATRVVNRPSLLARLGALADVYRQRLQARIEAYRQRRHAPQTEMATATTLTGSPTTLRNLLKPLEPRPVRIGLSALMVILLTAAVLTFVLRGSNDQRLYDAAVAANNPAAYQQYLQSCKQCLQRADAQAAVTRFATVDKITGLKRQFKELLGRGVLAAPADPNAGAVLRELEGLATGDAELPVDRRALADALKRQRHAAPKKVAVQVPPKQAVAHAKRPATRPAHTLAQTKTSVASGKPAAADTTVEPVAQPISQVQPKYPQGARSYGKAGWVEVDFMVNIDGSASDAQVLAAQPKDIFDEAALHAVHIAVFKPYTVDGVRERKRMRLRIDFKP